MSNQGYISYKVVLSCGPVLLETNPIEFRIENFFCDPPAISTCITQRKIVSHWTEVLFSHYVESPYVLIQVKVDRIRIDKPDLDQDGKKCCFVITIHTGDGLHIFSNCSFLSLFF